MTQQISSSRTSNLIAETQESLTQAMMIRSAPTKHGGLPIALRSIMLALGEDTIMQGNTYETRPAATVIGRVIEKYYIAGDRALGADIAKMSDQPFPLIVPYTLASQLDEGTRDRQSSFVNSKTGNNTSFRYMMIQLSRLGAEYLLDMEHFPKTYNMENSELVSLNIRSHVPVECLRTTNFITTGKGSNSYSMCASELFATMAQMIEYGYDIPVEELKHFKGFDFGDPNRYLIMKPEGLASLFNIGVSTVIEKIPYEIDLHNKTINFKALHQGWYGDTLEKGFKRRIMEHDGQFLTMNINYQNVSNSIHDNHRLSIAGIQFKTDNLKLIVDEFEDKFEDLIYFNYNHFAHNVDVQIEDKFEKGYKLNSRSVREILTECIENFYLNRKDKYLGEARKLEEEIAEYLIMEKVTRPYMATKIRDLLLEPQSIRVSELKKYADEKTAENSIKHPEITIQEITDYVWRDRDQANFILANLNTQGHEYYRSLIEAHQKEIDKLRKKASKDALKEEARIRFVNLSKEDSLQRKSPIWFLNSGINVRDREQVANFISSVKEGDLPNKIQVFPGTTVVKTQGENLKPGYKPSYTIFDNDIAVLKGTTWDIVSKHEVREVTYGSSETYIQEDYRFVIPNKAVGIYLTNLGRVGFWLEKNIKINQSCFLFKEGEYVMDFVPINDFVNRETLTIEDNRVMVFVTENKIIYKTLEELYIAASKLGDIGYINELKFTHSIDVIKDMSEINQLFLWNYKQNRYRDLSHFDWEYNPIKLDTQYIPNSLVSTNKKAYLNGLHLPYSILNEIAETNITGGEFNYDYIIPKGLDKYILIIKDGIENNDPIIVEDLKQKVSKGTTQLIKEGKLNPDGYPKLINFDFIRDIRIV